nr:integrase, catalytic region, zinc finger, CCHC-type, peptidase aspartic, catalytic [Tanacetum cinerariifolium]
MVEETTFLKRDFKQKENKLLAEFLNMKSLKEKVEDELVKQDQSLQTVHMLCRPRPLYNDHNKVAIGYKNPLCLTHAKQAQPALYNGYEILKDNHTRAKVYNTEDTLEIVEITRKKMNAKMTDPECVTHKVKIAPHDYSKENLLATFTPQKQLTPEQIYWSNDLMKLKSEALKEWAKVSKPIKVFTVYPPNTPATLVPKVLPTTSQVKIHIFTLIQLFSKFDKTCKKRITPSAITDEERGFEQTKACYLQELIPFFQTIKDNFEGIQKALTKEVKQMKDMFTELEAEVAQCAVDRKHDAIDRKNLFIANDNLIAKCLSKEVFSVAMKSELNVARFAKMYVANTSVEARCLALEAELATLRDKSHQENQGELIKHFSKLEGKDNVIRQLKKQLSRNNRDAHLDYLRHLKESVETIHDIVEEAKVTNVPVPHSIGVKPCPKASGSQPKSNHKTNRISPAKGANKLPVEDLPKTNKSHLRTTNHVDSSSRLKRTVINSNSNSICQTCNKCLTSFDHDMCMAVYVKSVWLPHSTRQNCEIDISFDTKTSWKSVEAHRQSSTHHWSPMEAHRPDTPLRDTMPLNKVHSTPSGCSKHMMGDRSRLLNFVKKFIGIVRFGNDHFGAIMGYGDYVVGENVISRVYYVEVLGHNLFSVGQFCDFDLEVAFRKHSCYVRDTDGVDLIKGSCGSNLYTILVEDMMKSSLICLLFKASKNKS